MFAVVFGMVCSMLLGCSEWYVGHLLGCSMWYIGGSKCWYGVC